MSIPKVFGSSVDPKKVSETWEGALLALIPIIVLISKGQIDAETLNGIVYNVMDFVSAIVGAVAAFKMVWVSVRKVLVKFDVIKLDNNLPNTPV